MKKIAIIILMFTSFCFSQNQGDTLFVLLENKNMNYFKIVDNKGHFVVRIKKCGNVEKKSKQWYDFAVYKVRSWEINDFNPNIYTKIEDINKNKVKISVRTKIFFVRKNSKKLFKIYESILLFQE